MPNHNYHVLSPTEFENLARDLVQRKENIVLETFKEGKDSGIDMRYADAQNKSLIVQAKRYKDDYDVLYKKLKDVELPKVKKLKPKRYIIVTSVGLTPLNKIAIVTLFGGYIQSTSDIIGKDDIDNLIGLNEDLEKKHFKLWLTSTNIMQEVLNSKEYNQSHFELEKIAEEIKFYVQNGSFEKAQEIITRERFVVISGIPGIGKTTLARMLAYRYLAEGYEHFIYVSGDINDALTLYSPGKRQVFFYDDFLGENFLSERLSKNEDKRIISFIDKIQRDNDKILIMTTREYILRQAESTYPAIEQLKTAKATLELSDYTEVIKAQILFNHLFFNDLNPDYLDNIIDGNNYLKIIQHDNYSPRIIAAIAKDKIWEDVEPADFTTEIIKYLDHPFKIWENVFETKISKLSQVILTVLSISGAPMLIDDLRKSTEAHVLFTSPEFKSAIKELEHTFIITQADRDGVIALEFQNNSIQDYMLHYLKSNRPELLKLLQNMRYFSQGADMFLFPKTEDGYGLTLVQAFTPINHDQETLGALKNAVTERLEELLPSSKVIRYSFEQKDFKWLKSDDGKLEWLVKTLSWFDLDKDQAYRKKLVNIVSKIDPYEAEIDEDFSSLLRLRFELQSYLSIDKTKFIHSASRKIKDFRALERFCELGDAFKPEFIDFVVSDAANELQEKAMEWCQIEFAKGMAPTVDSPSSSLFSRLFFKAEMERICDEINYVSERLGLGITLDSEYHKEYVRSKLKENEIEEDLNPKGSNVEVISVIKEMFESLRH